MMTNKPEFTIDQTKEVVCPCGCNYYKEVTNLREISPLLSGKTMTTYAPVLVYICIKCEKPFEFPKIIA